MKLTHLFTAILAGALALGNVANAADTLTTEQKIQVESIVHDYLLKNPQVIIQAVQDMQKKQYDDMAVKIQKIAIKDAPQLFNQAADPVAGNQNGKVTMVEFFDYQCPHCVDMAPVIDGLVKANAELRVVYKEFPIRGQMSVDASKAALAANKQGKYLEYHLALMKNAANLTPDYLLVIAKNIGLNLDRFKTDMKSPEVENQIKDNYKLAQELQLMGTPAIFAGKTKDATTIEFIPGQVDQATLQKTVDKVIH